MVADLNNVNNQLKVPADFFKQTQQSLVGKNPNRSPVLDTEKFPANDKIDELVALALDPQKKGNILERGSIVNILV